MALKKVLGCFFLKKIKANGDLGKGSCMHFEHTNSPIEILPAPHLAVIVVLKGQIR